MTADTLQGNSVGIGEAADFTPPERCKLHTRVCSLMIIGLVIDASHWCCRDGSFLKAMEQQMLASLPCHCG